MPRAAKNVNEEERIKNNQLFTPRTKLLNMVHSVQGCLQYIKSHKSSRGKHLVKIERSGG